MINAAIAGATGYTGIQLINLLKHHPHVRINALTANSNAGEAFSKVFPSHLKMEDRICDATELERLSKTNDVIFLALPHGIASKTVTQEVLANTRIIDLGADFRLKNINEYEEWYKMEHFGTSILSEAVYGLSEIYREQVKTARLVANPGCYTTASILSLYPAVKYGLIDPASIIIDAKSGVSGAGRGLSLGNHFCEANESIKAYGVTTHRHTPEIEQELSFANGSPIHVTFTPHLIPMQRGILSVCYASLKKSVSKKEIEEAYVDMYGKEPFIRIRRSDDLPQTNYVKGSNYFDVTPIVDKRTDRLIAIGALDNLMKGAASQAVQNMNIMFGYKESMGIDDCPLYL